jgi:hypothetical protein
MFLLCRPRYSDGGMAGRTRVALAMDFREMRLRVLLLLLFKGVSPEGIVGGSRLSILCCSKSC